MSDKRASGIRWWGVFSAMALILLALGGVAQAHRLSFSKGRWIIDGGAGAVTLELAIDSLAVPPVTALTPPEDPDTRAAWWPEHAGAVQDAFGRGMTLTSQAGACQREANRFETRKAGDLVVMGFRWTCAAPITTLSIDLGFVGALPSDHKHIARVDIGGKMLLRAFSHEALSWQVPKDALIKAEKEQRTEDRGDLSRHEPTPATASGPSMSQAGSGLSFGELLVAGMHHIWSGWDHLAFLLALLAIGGRLRYLLGIVTSFTVAHSLTLGLAALHIVELDSQLVEAGIAATIVFVAVENFWIQEGRWRWVLTFAFGLIHGFGFASFLGDLQLPPAALAGPLVAFNLGVEIGQIAVVTAIFPALLWASRRSWHRRLVVYPLSAAIALAGLWWLAERTLLT